MEVNMGTSEDKSAEKFTSQWIYNANIGIIEDLNKSAKDHRHDISGLKVKLSTAYWSILVFSSLTFILGLVLLLVPAITAFRGETEMLTSLITGGFGLADLAALFIYRPIERIHKIMGDMSQIILVLNSYEYQVGLLLVEMEVNNKESVGIAAEKIGKVSSTKIAAIEKYFEAKATETEGTSKPDK